MSEALTFTVKEVQARGGVPLGQFLSVAGALERVMREVNSVLNLDHEVKADAEIVIVYARYHSVEFDLLVKDSPSAPYEVAREVTDAVMNGLEQLQREAQRPPLFSDTAMKFAEQLVQPQEDTLIEVSLQRHDQHLVLTPSVAQHVRALLAPRLSEITSVEGRIYRMNTNAQTFGLYDARRKHAIQCRYPVTLFEQVREALDRAAFVFGKAHTDATGAILSMEARRIRLATPSGSRRTIDELYGSIPDLTDGLDSVAYVRAHRGEETTDK